MDHGNRTATATPRSIASPTELARRYSEVRSTSRALAAPLSAEDCAIQSMPDASPTKWHLAHTTWFFETFLLSPGREGYTPFNPAFKVLFNSYYNGVGDKHPRPERGLLSRPALVRRERAAPAPAAPAPVVVRPAVEEAEPQVTQADHPRR